MTLAAAIFGAVRNNNNNSRKFKASSYEELIGNHDGSGSGYDESSTELNQRGGRSNINNNNNSSNNKYKYLAFITFSIAAFIFILSLNYKNNNGNDKNIINDQIESVESNQVALSLLYATEPSSNLVNNANNHKQEEQDLIIKINQGSILGKKFISRQGREILGFLGIPYAKPPIGELRFKPPQEPDAWEETEVRNATTFTPECIQNGKHDGSGGLKGSEDCLYLNVFTPKTIQELNNSTVGKRRPKYYPVLFYIHGGGLAGNIFVNTPEYLLDENVILVTLHYRLGILGTLNTQDAEAMGNQGLKDQSMGLKWVASNIKYFGGDSNKVTLFGNSYGSIGVSLHLLSPLSSGLFHRVICQSGNVLDPAMLSPHPRQDAFDLGSKLNCTSAVSNSNSTQLLECFRGLNASELVITTMDATVQQIFLHSVEPTTTGDVFLPDEPLKLMQAGKVNRVPAIFGVNSAEGQRETFAILNTPQLLTEFNTNFETIAPSALHLQHLNSTAKISILQQLRNFYFPNNVNISYDTRQNLTDMFADRNFVHPNYVQAGFQLINNEVGNNHSLNSNNNNNNNNRNSNNGGRRGRRNNNPNNVYLYYLTKQVDVSYFIHYQLSPKLNASIKDQNGAGHVDELQFLFPYSPPFPIIEPGSKHYNFSCMMIKLWTSFADTGIPSTDDDETIEEWLPIQSPKPFSWYQLDDRPTMTSLDNDLLLDDRMKLWDGFNLNDLYV